MSAWRYSAVMYVMQILATLMPYLQLETRETSDWCAGHGLHELELHVLDSRRICAGAFQCQQDIA